MGEDKYVPGRFFARGFYLPPEYGGNMKKVNSKVDTKKIVLLALFSALSYATLYVLRFKVSFLTFEAKDAVITIAAMCLGPAAGVVISLVVTLLEMVTVSDTGFYGWIMNFAASAVFSVTASLFYSKIRKVWAAVTGLAAAGLSMTVVMLLMNLVITPLYAGVTVDAVLKMIPPLLLPFNLTKAALNSALVMVLYKPVSSALKRTNMLPHDKSAGDAGTYRLRGKSLIVLLAGLAVIFACVFIMIYILGGDFSLIRN
jgi:riboflavin transporter FmnP